MALDLSDLEDIVASADFGRLTGEVEGQFFDAKGQPYRFDTGMDAKREFAKDVASFANSNGGYIFVGLDTRPAVLRAGEEVTEPRPVDRALFDPDRHQKIVTEWLFPSPKDLQIEWVPFGTDQGKGIGVISIPPQNERSKPFLITRAMGDKKSTEMLIGYAERRNDTTEVRNIIEIHHALRTGFNLERELIGRIASLELLLQQHFSAQAETETTEKRRDLLKTRVSRLLKDVEA